MEDDKLIPKHGGFRKLKSFQLARLIFDLTTRFCDKFISIKSRTHDQMVQAARSGVQNIAEGSQASGTSKKTELKLTGVARASLEELKLDYEDFLRQRNFNKWDYHDPRRKEFMMLRFDDADEFARWVQKQVPRGWGTVPEIAANGLLVLIVVTCTFLDRQLASQEKAFLNEGGFTERMYKMRNDRKAK